MRDDFAPTVAARREMLQTLCAVYERYGFEPLETPAIEYVETLGKFLPEADTPEGGIYALRDDDDEWIALRYDLTAPLSRVFAQNQQTLPRPFRRYQAGPVWRALEKPAPGRYRQFWQCDFDSVGSKSIAADAEVCLVLAAAFDALGLAPEDVAIHVNNRKILNGVLDRAGVDDSDQRLAVLRAVDKLDRLSMEGVVALLGGGRKDPSGDFTPGAQLEADQIDGICAFLSAGGGGRAAVCDRLGELVLGSEIGEEGVAELVQLDALVSAGGLDASRVRFDPSMVRGLAYYTGPVFEATLCFEVLDEKGRPRQFGSVVGGGRYDDLVERFTGQKVPATGASIGVDRLLAGLHARTALPDPVGPVVVTVMDKARLVEYQEMVQDLRAAGVRAELFLGSGNVGKQFKYADRRAAPAAVIAGADEFAAGEVAIKDLDLGRELSKEISERASWTSDRPAQFSVKRDALVQAVVDLLAQRND